METGRTAMLHRPVVPHPGAGDDVPLADHLERLGVVRCREPAPVARGRVEEVGGEVAADAGLRLERGDRLQLAPEDVIDGDESARAELDRRGRRLVRVDAGNAPGGDQARVVGCAVVLVDVARAVRVDRGRAGRCSTTSEIARMVAAVSEIAVSSRSSMCSSAAITSAARWDSSMRMLGWPPASPLVRVRRWTSCPTLLCRSNTPPQPISTSSGCAPIASTVS